MNVKELIQALNKLDPKGTREVFVIMPGTREAEIRPRVQP